MNFAGDITDRQFLQVLSEAFQYLVDRKLENGADPKTLSWAERNRRMPSDATRAKKVLESELSVSKDELTAGLVDDPEWQTEWIDRLEDAIEYLDINGFPE